MRLKLGREKSKEGYKREELIPVYTFLVKLPADYGKLITNLKAVMPSLAILDYRVVASDPRTNTITVRVEATTNSRRISHDIPEDMPAYME